VFSSFYCVRLLLAGMLCTGCRPLLVHLGTWVDFDFKVRPSYLVALPFVPKSEIIPKENRADRGTAKIKVNPSQVRELMKHPVCVS